MHMLGVLSKEKIKMFVGAYQLTAQDQEVSAKSFFASPSPAHSQPRQNKALTPGPPSPQRQPGPG